ncbi:hypothetical protein FRC12_002823 [Ceratobasidium sp. 428]|nr:hypothetical protein FRC12_002823 [Ceratobasidium sp. 428]
MRSTPLFTFLLTLLCLLSFSLASPAPAPLVPDAPALVERAPGDNSTEVDPVGTSGGGSGNRGGKSTPTAQSGAHVAGTISVARKGKPVSPFPSSPLFNLLVGSYQCRYGSGSWGSKKIYCHKGKW